MAADVDSLKRSCNKQAGELAELDAKANKLAALISEYEMKLRDARAQYHAIDSRIGPARFR